MSSNISAQTHIGTSQYNEVIDLEGHRTVKPLTYLDSTATSLADSAIFREVKSFLKDGYANTHTTGHHRGRDSTEAVNAARDSVGKFVGYDPKQDLVIFNGSGATEPLNYLAQVLFPKTLRILNNPSLSNEAKDAILETLSADQKRVAKEIMDKPIIITTEMEHHSNQLPWYDDNVKIIPVNKTTGELDLDALKSLLEEHKGKIRLVTVSGASNVTGIMNPIYDIAKMAHEAGAEMCVDAAQLAPHYQIQKRRPNPQENLDYIAMSPHKFGVTGTPGVLVANRSLLDGRRNLVNLGGGIVNVVTAFPPEFTPIEELDMGEEPGTPNVVGIIAVGLKAAELTKNMPKLTAHEKELTRALITKLQGLADGGVQVIGAPDPEKRVGVVSFMVEGVSHEIVTAFLNDHWNIATRNGCFCAHPLIIKMSGATEKEINRIRSGNRSNIFGYVRASLGENNTERDVDTLVSALTELVQNKQKVLDMYSIDSHGNAIRKDGFVQAKGWSFNGASERILVAKELAELGFNKKEVSSLLPLVSAHGDYKKLVQAVQAEVAQHSAIDNKTVASKDVLLTIYNADTMEKGENAAKVRNQPVYKSDNGKIQTVQGWEKYITSVVNAQFPAEQQRAVN